MTTLTKSEVIFKNGRYTASAMKDGSLIIERNKALKNGQKGIRMIGPNTKHWIANIREAVANGDNDEAAMLCRCAL